MKILNYKEKGDMLKVTTNNIDMPVFVYFKDKFETVEQLEAEINKKILEVETKKVKKLNKLDKLKTGLDKKVKL